MPFVFVTLHIPGCDDSVTGGKLLVRGARRFAGWSEFELDTLEGLEPFAVAELEYSAGSAAREIDLFPGAVRFRYDGDPQVLLGLRSVVAAYLVLWFAAPRPRALLGHEHMTRLCNAIDEVLATQAKRYHTMRLSAAGDDSRVLERLKQALMEHTGLIATADGGDLLLRLRRSRYGDGWEMLVRLTPRPLATREWRVCNRPGAPNATLAHAMVLMTQPSHTDRVLNIACGSGTLLIERLVLARVRSAIGCDSDREALQCAQRNLHAAECADLARLESWDATALPLPDASVDVICADLPFGQLIGSHRDNETLYPRLIAEAARVAADQARMVLLTHEVRLLERTLEQYAHNWIVEDVLRVRSSGMTPRIFLLRRHSNRRQ